MQKEDYGRAIRALRGRRNQKEVAKRAGISPASWSSYERAKRCPKLENLHKIARGLGCSFYRLEEEAWFAERDRLRAEEGTELAWPAAGTRGLIELPASQVEDREAGELTMPVHGADHPFTSMIEQAVEIAFRKWRELER